MQAPTLIDYRRRLAEFETDLPAIVGIEIDGRRPTAAEVARIRYELYKAPLSVIEQWRARGGRCEVVSGWNAAIHPEAMHRVSGGWHRNSLLVVAADCSELTPLHELGHAHDIGRRFSSLPTWKELFRFEDAWRYATTCPPIPDAHHMGTAAECFAQAFAMYFSCEYYRKQLSGRMSKFIEWAASQ